MMYATLRSPGFLAAALCIAFSIPAAAEDTPAAATPAEPANPGEAAKLEEAGAAASAPVKLRSSLVSVDYLRPYLLFGAVTDSVGSGAGAVFGVGTSVNYPIPLEDPAKMGADLSLEVSVQLLNYMRNRLDAQISSAVILNRTETETKADIGAGVLYRYKIENWVSLDGGLKLSDVMFSGTNVGTFILGVGPTLRVRANGGVLSADLEALNLAAGVEYQIDFTTGDETRSLYGNPFDQLEWWTGVDWALFDPVFLHVGYRQQRVRSDAGVGTVYNLFETGITLAY